MDESRDPKKKHYIVRYRIPLRDAKLQKKIFTDSSEEAEAIFRATYRKFIFIDVIE